MLSMLFTLQQTSIFVFIYLIFCNLWAGIRLFAADIRLFTIDVRLSKT